MTGLMAGSVPVPLLGVEVRGEVLAGRARVTVSQRYRSDEAKPIEAIYTFPLPTRAAITGFSMTVNGRRLLGEVHERTSAFAKYEEAITTGHGAALLEQERANVFTANVGNLLPGEETTIELEYVERLVADEGSIRWSIPTLVAPRYLPAGGAPVSPPIGQVAYGIGIDLVFDLGVAVDITSPSHAIVVTDEGTKARVAFVQRETRLDRDVVLLASPKSYEGVAPLTSVIAHKEIGKQGVFALTVVPDLSSKAAKKHAPKDVVFVLDRSGSMGGGAMTEARTALRLCLRQLAEGDRFNIVAFDDLIDWFAPEMLPFTQATLEKADRWLQTIDARGGTELLAPLVEAGRLAPDGIIVLLTDGQVGNEDQILRVFLDARRTARVFAFGIGTNVSDVLLDSLATHTGGALESIHPGERVDEKVIAQFARATALRVTELSVKIRGVETFEIAPAAPIALVDGEPLAIFGKFEHTAMGAIEIRGKLEDENFYYEVPVDLTDASERPFVEKLWAQARIEDLERAELVGRRAEAMKDRIVKLAIEHGISSRHASFVVVESRAGDRRASEQAATRIVAVEKPANWEMFQNVGAAQTRCGWINGNWSLASVAACRRTSQTGAAPAMPDGFDGDYASVTQAGFLPPPAFDELDPVQETLAAQSASGLWEFDDNPIRQTVDRLVYLLRENVDAAHPIYGAQIKKAIDALLARVVALSPADDPLLELALGVAWLMTSGRRTRHEIQRLAKTRLSALFSSEPHVRARVEALTNA